MSLIFFSRPDGMYADTEAECQVGGKEYDKRDNLGTTKYLCGAFSGVASMLWRPQLGFSLSKWDNFQPGLNLMSLSCDDAGKG